MTQEMQDIGERSASGTSSFEVIVKERKGSHEQWSIQWDLGINTKIGNFFVFLSCRSTDTSERRDGEVYKQLKMDVLLLVTKRRLCKETITLWCFVS